MQMTKKILATLLIFLSLGFGIAHSQQKDVHDLKPKHGGIVSESNHMEFELAVQPDFTYLYIRDHGKPVDLSQAKAKLTILDAGKKHEVSLGGGTDALQGNAITLGGKTYTAVATVEFASKKKVTVRFKSK
jgi:hypothetical protein